MNILILSTNSDLSGAPIHVRDLTTYLNQKLDINSRIYNGFGKSGTISRQLEKKGYRVHYFNYLSSSLNIFHDILVLIRVIQFIKDKKIDLLHLHSTKAGFIGRLAKLFTNSKVVFTVHGWGFGPGHPILTSTLVYAQELLTNFLVDHYIFVSNFDIKLSDNILPIRSNRKSLIYNVSKSTIQVKTVYDKSLITVARNSPQKDFATLFKALKYVEFDKLYILGSGTDNEDFITQARELSDTNFHKIEFIGATEAVQKYLEMSSIFILMSHYEGLPISIIEAMSKSMPIIASDVGGCSELVKNELNGYLIPHENVADLIEKINFITLNPIKAKLMGEKSLEIFLEKFSKFQTEDYIKIYKSVLSDVQQN